MTQQIEKLSKDIEVIQKNKNGNSGMENYNN